MTPLRLAAFIAVFAFLTTAGSASAAFGPTIPISPAGQDSEAPQVAMDAAGNSIFTWRRTDGAGGVYARSRSASGVLGEVQSISEPGDGGGEPQVAVNSAGTAWFVWTHSPSAGVRVIQARRRAPDGTLGDIEDVSSVTGAAQVPQVGVDQAGDAYAVWTSVEATGILIQATKVAEVGPIFDLSAGSGDADNPQVAVDPGGDAHFVWQRSDGTDTVVQGRDIEDGGSLGATFDLSNATGESTSPQLASFPGELGATVDYVWKRDGLLNFLIQARRRTPLSTGTVQDLSQTIEDGATPQIAGHPDSPGVQAVWRQGIKVETRARLGDGSLQAVQPLSTAGRQPQVARDAAGSSTFVWLEDVGTDLLVQVRQRSAAGVLGATQTLSAAGADAETPQVAANASGKAAATWVRPTGGDDLVQGAFDPPPPAVPGGGGNPPAGGPKSGPPVAGAPADTAAPVISRLRVSPRRSRRPRIAYTLTEGATVTFRLLRRRAGRRVKGKCRRPTAKNRARRRCELPLAGSLKHRGGKGANRLRFSGRLKGRRLRPGSYVLVAVARDAAGNSSKPRRARLSIVR